MLYFIFILRAISHKLKSQIEKKMLMYLKINNTKRMTNYIFKVLYTFHCMGNHLDQMHVDRCGYVFW
jgi:hypothetical protein